MPRIANSPARSRSAASSVLVPVLPARDAVHFPGLINTLLVIREPSLKAVRKSIEADRRVVVLSQRDMSQEDPQVGDLYRTGTLSEALQALPMPDTSLRVVLRGLSRVRVVRLVTKNGAFWAQVEPIEETVDPTLEGEATMRACVESFGKVVGLNKLIPPEAMQSVVHLEEPGPLADAIAHHLPLRPAQKQELLEKASTGERIRQVLALLKREEQLLDLNAHIHQQVERELGDSQREFYLREQLKVIQQELQEREDRVGESDEYRERIEVARMPEQAREKAMAEIRRLDRMPASSPEGMVVRNYLDTMVELPWSLLTEDRLDVNAAQELLDQAHFGLDKVKTRILDYLAVRQLKGSLRGPILCFVGPPGVGKTSLGRSIADAMGRRFVRLSLGGVRDESEIHGHRRTYVGSMTGRILAGLRQCGSRNPVFMLDEIDKLSSDFRGDPTSALLEALDPEQNDRFSDHYLEVPFDLSAVMFIATANLIENIPGPLRDRMEVIYFPSYTDEERTQIGRSFLIPKALEEHGLKSDQVTISDHVLASLVSEYTREAGVRNLERQIGAVCRKSARLVAEGKAKRLNVEMAQVHEYLGRPRHKRPVAEEADQIGAATGLVVSEQGGDVITIEVSLMEPLGERPDIRLTGNLGDVMKESAQAAVTYIRANEAKIRPDGRFRYDVHVHVPEGGIPKDGPSAGVTIAVALASAFTGKPVRADVAMTGEITLRGKVIGVGGIRDKVLAAHRAGIKIVLVPEENVPDLDDVPPAVRQSLDIRPISTLDEALSIAL